MRISSFNAVLAGMGGDVHVIVHLTSGVSLSGVALMPADDTPKGVFVLSRAGKPDQNDVTIDINAVVAIELNEPPT